MYAVLINILSNLIKSNQRICEALFSCGSKASLKNDFNRCWATGSFRHTRIKKTKRFTISEKVKKSYSISTYDSFALSFKFVTRMYLSLLVDSLNKKIFRRLE